MAQASHKSAASSSSFSRHSHRTLSSQVSIAAMLMPVLSEIVALMVLASSVYDIGAQSTNATQVEAPGSDSSNRSKVLLFQNQTARKLATCCRGHLQSRSSKKNYWAVNRLEPNRQWSCENCNCKDIKDSTGSCTSDDPQEDDWSNQHASTLCVRNVCYIWRHYRASFYSNPPIRCRQGKLKFKFKLTEMVNGDAVTEYGDMDWLNAGAASPALANDLDGPSWNPPHIDRNGPWGRGAKDWGDKRCVDLAHVLEDHHLASNTRLMIELRAKRKERNGGVVEGRMQWKQTDRIYLGTLLYDPNAGKKTLNCYPRDHRKHPDCWWSSVVPPYQHPDL